MQINRQWTVECSHPDHLRRFENKLFEDLVQRDGENIVTILGEWVPVVFDLKVPKKQVVKMLKSMGWRVVRGNVDGQRWHGWVCGECSTDKGRLRGEAVELRSGSRSWQK